MNEVHPLDSTRQMAADALERASSTMKDLRYGVSDRASAAQRYVGEYASASKRYVADHPLEVRAHCGRRRRCRRGPRPRHAPPPRPEPLLLNRRAMVHPIFSVLITKPELVMEHVAGYASLVREEASSVGKDVARRAIAWGVTLFAVPRVPDPRRRGGDARGRPGPVPLGVRDRACARPGDLRRRLHGRAQAPARESVHRTEGATRCRRAGAARGRCVHERRGRTSWRAAARRSSSLARRQRRDDPREELAGPAFAACPARRTNRRPIRAPAGSATSSHAVRTRWRYHPAHMAVDLAAPLLRGYPARSRCSCWASRWRQASAGASRGPGA